MTCYLILDCRPTYFSYFQKITAISHSYNVKKVVDPKDPFPVAKGFNAFKFFSSNFLFNRSSIQNTKSIKNRQTIEKNKSRNLSGTRDSDEVELTKTCSGEAVIY